MVIFQSIDAAQIKSYRMLLNQSRTSMPNKPFQRTRATKRLGVFGFCGVAQGAERGRWARIDTLSDTCPILEYRRRLWTKREKSANKAKHLCEVHNKLMHTRDGASPLKGFPSAPPPPPRHSTCRAIPAQLCVGAHSPFFFSAGLDVT
jgi:hypothetical protein